MNFSERRRYVRVNPRAELPIRAAVPGRGILQDPITVVDVSVGGVAVACVGPFASASVGERYKLRLTFATYGSHEVEVEVRRRDAQVVGFEFVALSPEARASASRYVSELLERGAVL